MGKGIWQENEAREKRKLILNVLSDGKWHRHKEILEKTGLSPTTLSKHLKELEKSIVEKRIDIQSGEYPYPVYYRLKPFAISDEIKKQRELSQCTLDACLDVFLDCKWLAPYFRTLAFWLISEISANFSAYLLHDLSDEWLEQVNEYFLFEPLHETLGKFKKKLLELKDRKEAYRIIKTAALQIMLEYVEAQKKEDIPEWQAFFSKLEAKIKPLVKESASINE